MRPLTLCLAEKHRVICFSESVGRKAEAQLNSDSRKEGGEKGSLGNFLLSKLQRRREAWNGMRWDLILLSHVIALRTANRPFLRSVIDLGGHARYKLIDLFCPVRPRNPRCTCLSLMLFKLK